MKQFLICISFLFCLSITEAQQYLIKNFGVTEGLGQSQAQSIAQDSLGYLWIGTMGGGLSRFDGSEFKSFTKKDGLASNFVLSIQVLTDGNLLVGTSKGLSKVSADTILSNFTNSPLDSITIEDISLPFIATSNGLFHYENNTTIRIENKTPKCNNYIREVLTVDSTIWAATGHGIVKITDSITTCKTDLNRVHNNDFTSIILDINGNIWVGSLGGGITKISPLGKQTNYSKSKGLNTFNVSCLFEDSKHNIWIGSHGQGISKFDGKNFIHITQENGLSNDYVRSICEDHLGNIWFGTSNGLSKYEGDKYLLHDKTSFIPHGGAYSLFQSHDSTLWMGTSQRGLFSYKNGNTNYYSSHNGFTSAKVKVIYETADSTIWIGTDGRGLYQFKDDSFSKVDLGNIWIRDIKEDTASHQIFIATLGQGLIRITSDTITKTPVGNNLKSNRINQIELDTVTWLATDHGAYYYSNDSIFQVDQLPKERFISLSKNNNGTTFWGNIGQGVYIFNKGKVSQLNSSNGINSDNVYALYSEQNKLWVGTEKGLDELIFNEKTEIISNQKHTTKEGFLGIELIRNCILKDVHGNYWFGTVNGVTQYSPQEKRKSSSPNLILHTVELFYQPLKVSTSSGTNLTLEKNEFEYNQNHFTFRFKGIDLNSNNLSYRWRMIGLDDIWNIPTSQNFATYSNLPSGSYLFEVQTLGTNGEWSSPTSQHFIIAQPYWETTWFKVSVILGFILILAIILGFIIRSFIRKNRANNEKQITKRRIVELEQQALRLQMNPHFLFNSLNAIKGSVAQQQTKEAKRAIDQFAKLMRLMLDNTREGFVLLSQEILLIEQYLALELLNHEFVYHIKVEKNVSDNCLIPAMMIQPLVENAVLHGISPLKGNGVIQVTFKQASTGILLCEISDNGIGRKASQKAKENSVHKQKSRATEIIESRLLLISETNSNTGIEIIDKDDGETGTIVNLSLPIKQTI